MEIKTKFNVGDIAYTIYDNRLYQVKIESVKTFTIDEYQSITYNVMVTDDMEGNITLDTEISENRLFKDIQTVFHDLENCMYEFDETKTRPF